MEKLHGNFHGILGSLQGVPLGCFKSAVPLRALGRHSLLMGCGEHHIIFQKGLLSEVLQLAWNMTFIDISF